MRLARALHGCAAAVLLASHPAAAQDGSDVARRGLIEEAAAVARVGDHARAIELATRAAAIRQTPSLRYFLAREHLRVGHAIEALAFGGACAAAARGDVDVPNREALLARCRVVVAEAELAIARLTVRAPSPVPPELRVTIAGVPLASSLFDVAFPVAAGPIEVTATAAGRAPFHASLALAAGARETLSLDLPELPSALPAPPLVAAPLPVIAPPPVIARRPVVAAGPGPGPWIVGSVGLAGLAAAGVFGAVAVEARNDRDEVCPAASHCDLARATAFDDRYRGAALGANVALGVGAALAVGAITWWIAARVRGGRQAYVAWSPAGVALRW